MMRSWWRVILLSRCRTAVSSPQILQGAEKVRAVFVNILAGITRCDEVAKGIVDVKKVMGLKKPLVIRMVGTNQEEGRRILKSAGLTAMDKMDEAARLAVSKVGA